MEPSTLDTRASTTFEGIGLEGRTEMRVVMTRRRAPGPDAVWELKATTAPQGVNVEFTVSDVSMIVDMKGTIPWLVAGIRAEGTVDLFQVSFGDTTRATPVAALCKESC